jgi:hypothetical protein
VIRAARVAYLVLAWALVVGLVVQVFLIGMGLFSDPSWRQSHKLMGYALHFAPLLVLGAAWFAKAGRSHWQWALALAVVGLIAPVLPALGMPVVAALHPVGAVIEFGLALVVAWKAWSAYGLGPEAVPAS